MVPGTLFKSNSNAKLLAQSVLDATLISMARLESKGVFIASFTAIGAACPAFAACQSGATGAVSIAPRDASPDAQNDAETPEIIVLPRDEETPIALSMTAKVGELDVHINIDTTGSFEDEIDALSADLVGRIIPAIRARVPESSFGLSRFQDFPIDPFGTKADTPFTLMQSITSDERLLSNAVETLAATLGTGGDIPESGAEALYQVATGDGLAPWITPFDLDPAVGGGSLGGAGFRADATRVVVHITDAPSHDAVDYLGVVPGVHRVEDATSALKSTRIYFLGVASSPVARPQLENWALETGAVMDPVDGVCLTGAGSSTHEAIAGHCPLVFDIDGDGSGLSDQLIAGVRGLVDSIVYSEVHVEILEDSQSLVRSIETVGAEPPAGIEEPETTDRQFDDGLNDTFLGVRGGTRLDWRVVLKPNQQAKAGETRLVFAITADDIRISTQEFRVRVETE